MRHRRALRVSAALALPLLLTSCTATNEEAEQGERRGAGPGQVTEVLFEDTATPRLPVEDYLFGERQRRVLRGAEIVLTQTCMRNLGMDYTAAVASPYENTDDVGRVNRRYGAMVGEEVEKHGYHMPPTEPFERTPEKLSNREQRALMGAEGESGSAGPSSDGGCLGNARRTLLGGPGSMADSPLAFRIDLESYEKSMKRPEVVKVFARWSSCMRDRGFTYATPLDAMNDKVFRTDEPTSAEIDTATADADCKARTNVVPVWYKADRNLQAEAIAKHKDELTSVRSAMRTTMENATATLVDAGQLKTTAGGRNS